MAIGEHGATVARNDCGNANAPAWVLLIGSILGTLLLAYAVLRLTGFIPFESKLALAAVILGLVAVALIGTFVAATVLRAIVYFRDGHRAAHYGAADLIEIIRQIDHAVMEGSGPDDRKNFVQLSFIGHSMGGFVVTNAIRSLSDLFAVGAVKPNINAGVDTEGFDTIFANLGNAFHLMRFVLASPDIPAETLLSNRANYLAASLHRFHEAYLFSNEGDEVLRQISTTVNYFSFPTRSWTHGYRLGNVEILSKNYGLIEVTPPQLLDSLRVGQLTVQELYQKLKDAHEAQVQDRLPEVFSYFDCTDYIDADDEKKVRGLLTFAKRTKQNDPRARMRGFTHLRLLFAAYVFPKKPNMHGGYFEGELCQRLIFRLACLGARDAFVAFNGLDQLSRECREKQIRMLLFSQNNIATRQSRAGGSRLSLRGLRACCPAIIAEPVPDLDHLLRASFRAAVDHPGDASLLYSRRGIATRRLSELQDVGARCFARTRAAPAPR